jgi:hypothetical protein
VEDVVVRSGTLQDKTSKHYPPAKDLQSPEELLLAAMEHVNVYNMRSYGTRVAWSNTRTKELLMQDRMESAKVILRQGTWTFKLLCDAALSSNFAEVFTHEQVFSADGLRNDALGLPLPGIYLYGSFHLDTKSLVHLYIGKSKDCAMRASTHLANLKEGSNSRVLKTILAEAAAGDPSKVVPFVRVLCTVLAHMLESELLLLWEPTICAMMGTYRGNDLELRRRASYGLPQLSFKGSNASRCFEGGVTTSDIESSPYRKNPDLYILWKQVRREGIRASCFWHRSETSYKKQ